MTTADLERLLRHQQRVLEMFCRAAPLDETLAEIACALEEQLGDVRCAVLVEPASGLPDAVAAVTDPPSTVVEESGWSRPVRGGDGEVVGTFVVHPADLRRPSARERDLADRYAELAGAAVEHARLVGDLVAHQLAQREAELAREAAERHGRAKTEFLAAVAVELRTPVQAITGFAELLGSLDLDEPHRHEALRRIDHAAQDVLSVLEDVVDISLVEADALPLAPEQVVVGDVVAEATRLLAEGPARRQVEICDRTAGTTIVADRRRLRQVLVHLLTDAVQHGPPGGRVSVSAERTDGEARIDVGRLDGPGVPDQFRPPVFQPFRREDPGWGRGQDVEGFGIGLVVSHALASAMGGGLEMAVGPGHGTVMRLTLPAAPR
ncbi:sensor histidine kinase [Nocardioides taihuensis]|uniref:histidine kinase n=1 Tax=Nocardioides taihuensis TaxID=1835606 RepID=A0ABW0BIT5_9ACTN